MTDVDVVNFRCLRSWCCLMLRRNLNLFLKLTLYYNQCITALCPRHHCFYSRQPSYSSLHFQLHISVLFSFHALNNCMLMYMLKWASTTWSHYWMTASDEQWFFFLHWQGLKPFHDIQNNLFFKATVSKFMIYGHCKIKTREIKKWREKAQMGKRYL